MSLFKTEKQNVWLLEAGSILCVSDEDLSIEAAQDSLLHSFRSGTSACLVCIDAIKKNDPVGIDILHFSVTVVLQLSVIMNVLCSKLSAVNALASHHNGQCLILWSACEMVYCHQAGLVSFLPFHRKTTERPQKSVSAKEICYKWK